jgi:hypothetical protein
MITSSEGKFIGLSVLLPLDVVVETFATNGTSKVHIIAM